MEMSRWKWLNRNIDFLMEIGWYGSMKRGVRKNVNQAWRG
jgi:hypothetical protein